MRVDERIKGWSMPGIRKQGANRRGVDYSVTPDLSNDSEGERKDGRRRKIKWKLYIFTLDSRSISIQNRKKQHQVQNGNKRYQQTKSSRKQDETKHRRDNVTKETGEGNAATFSFRRQPWWTRCRAPLGDTGPEAKSTRTWCSLFWRAEEITQETTESA